MNRDTISKIKVFFSKHKRICKHIAIITFLMLVYFGFCAVVSKNTFMKVEKYINSEETGCVIGELKNGDIITQKLNNMSGTIYSVGFRAATYGNPNAGSGELTISLYDQKSNKLIGQVSGPMSQISDNAYFVFKFENAVDIQGRTDLLIKVEISEMKENDKFTVYLGTGAQNEAMLLNGNVTGGTLEVVMVKSEFDYFAKAVIFAMIVLAIFGCIMYYLIFIRENTKVEILYLVCAIVLGGLFFVFMPEFETPDEQRHIQTAYNVSNMFLGYKYDDDIEMRVIDYEQKYLRDEFDRNMYNEYIGQLIRGYGVDNDETVMLGNTPLSAPKYLYLFSGIGITIGRLLEFGTVPTYFLGSLLNYIVFVLIIYYSIKKIPVGKVVVFIIAMLPMTLQLATSYSYDCGIIALGTLLVSLALNIAYSDNVKKSDIIMLLITMLLFIPVKSCAYFMLALVTLLPIKKLWSKERKISYFLLGGLILSYCAVVLPIIIGVLFPTESESMLDGFIEWANEPGYTVGGLLSNPKRCVEIVYNTVLSNTSYYIHTMIGGYLGWLVIPVPWFITLFFIVLLIVSAMKVENETIQFSKYTKILFTSICVISICCVMAALLLDWTPASYTVIQGVQGRYFLPVLLVGLFVLRNSTIYIKEKVLKYCIFAVVLIQPYVFYSLISYMS